MLHRIDTHHHIPPKIYLDELKKIGITSAGGLAFPKWDVDTTLEMVDRFQITTAITSISSPGVYFGDTDFAIKLARKCNEFSAELIQSYPNRFGAFATLPLPDVTASLEELTYAGYT